MSIAADSMSSNKSARRSSIPCHSASGTHSGHPPLDARPDVTQNTDGGDPALSRPSPRIYLPLCSNVSLPEGNMAWHSRISIYPQSSLTLSSSTRTLSLDLTICDGAFLEPSSSVLRTKYSLSTHKQRGLWGFRLPLENNNTTVPRLR